MNKKYLIIIITAALVLAAVAYKFMTAERIQKQTRFLMDTYVTIQVPGGKEQIKKIEKAFDRMEEVDKKFSILDPDAALYKFNNLGTPVSDPEIIKIMKRAVRVSELSGGKFDVTIYPIMKLWGFYDTKHLPSKKDIAETLKLVNYKYLVIKDGVMTKTKKGVGVDIGGIAKLYAAEEGARMLKEQGVKSALMDVGGDILVLGKLNGKPWKVGVRNPRGDGVIAALDVFDTVVISSGDYERFFMQDGVRYHHLMDPKTGYPARGLSSVTILSGDPASADGMSAALFIMGKDAGLELVKKLGNLEAIFITEDQKIFYSEGLGGNVEVKKVKDLPKG